MYGVALLVAVPAAGIVFESVAAAATPAIVQSTSASGGGGVNAVVPITATLGSACTAGDTLIALVTIGQQNAAGGMVSATPAGWQRLYEHSPTDTSPYQGWFALSNCSSSVTSATFSVVAPNNSGGTQGSVVLTEYQNLPNPVAVDFATNDGSSSSTTADTLSGDSPASSGEATLTALSFYGSGTSSTPPSGWSGAGSATSSSLAAYSYFKIGTGSAPSAAFSWSPSASFEVTMLALKSGPAGVPNVVQENQAAISGTTASVTLPNAVSAGDALVALIGTNASAGSGSGFEATGVSGGGVTWASDSGFKQASNGTADIWAGFASSGGSQTVTATLPGSVTGQMVVAEISGIGATDGGNGTSGSSTSPTAPSISPHTGDFLVGLVTTNPSSLVQHPQPNWSTFSLAASTYGTEWQSDVPSGSETPQWNTSPSGNWIAVQAAFKAAVVTPSVSSVSPNSGSTAGGNAVTITGSSFIGVTAVSFGGTAATGFTVNSTTSITATAPASSVRTADVTVTAGGNTSATNSGDHYSYVPVAQPVVSGVSPAFGSGKGGATVTVTGSSLLNASGIAFGTRAGTIKSINGGGTSLVASTPPGTGTVDVTVTTSGGTSATSAADRYTYQGYWMVGSDGGVFAFGDAGFVGSLPGIGVHVNDIVGVVPTKDSGGYWMVGRDGGVFAFGDAGFVGSLPGLGVHVNDIVGVVPTPTGKGYWMVGSDGGVFAFGDAGFVGSLPGLGVHVNDIVGVVSTSTGKGYWMVGKDGGVFSFGNAGFVGSLPGDGVHVNDVVGVVPTATGKGYWMVGRDGGVFAFGDAGFVGSLPGLHVAVSDIVAVVPTKDSGGYWMVGSDGGAFAFGDAGFVGSLPGLGVKVSNIVAVVPT
jgi:IPT/TIG domain